MNTHNKIFLIGFMGSGKSTLGKRLANKLALQFFDLDDLIEKQEDLSINEIFEEKGEEYFRALESDILQKIVNKQPNFVLSLGGGTPCFNDNMEFVNQNGTSIYLKYNSGILFSRLKNAKADRPLLNGKSDDELKGFIEQKLTDREIFYNQCDLVIEHDNLTAEKVIELLK